MYARFIKPVLARLLALLLLPAAAAAVAAAALIILAFDRGPVFRRAVRLGLAGKCFVQYRLRVTAAGREHAPLTRAGRILRAARLDGLPQILNILRGDMCFVGPRPDPPDYIFTYRGEEIVRLSVRPGLTGYAEAFYGHGLSPRERLFLDARYARSASLRLDICIFFMALFRPRRGRASLQRPEGYGGFYIRPLWWDTGHFGISCACAELTRELCEDEWHELIRRLGAYRFAMLRNPAGAWRNNAWLGERTRAFPAGTALRLEKPPVQRPFDAVSDGVYITLRNMQDIDRELLFLMRGAFSHSRFCRDPHLKRQKAEELYEKWLCESFNKEEKWFCVARAADGGILACLLYSDFGGEAEIELFSASPARAVRELDARLLAAAERRLAALGRQRLSVEVSLSNIGALRFYQKYGFLIKSAAEVWHLWSKAEL